MIQRCLRVISRSCRSFVVLLLIVATALSPASALAAVCSADAFGCPATGICTIAGSWSVGEGCTIDFGLRDVALTGTIQSDALGGTFSLRAGSLALQGGKVKALGDASTRGGAIRLATEREFAMLGSGPTVDAHASAGGGSISIQGRSLTLTTGTVSAQGGAGDACGDGGTVSLAASEGALQLSSTVRVNAPGSDCAGGTIDLSGEDVSVAGELDARGGGGGDEEAIHIRATRGDVRFESTAFARADGTGQADGSGSDAGGVELTAAGDVLLNGGTISATGKAPDGAGGSVALTAEGSVLIASHIVVSGADDGVGGTISANAGGALTVSAALDALGGQGAAFGNGGAIRLVSGGDQSVGATLDVSGAKGGSITVKSAGVAAVSGQASARGTRVRGGVVSLSACTLQLAGKLDSNGTNGATGGFVDLAGSSIDLFASAIVNAAPCNGGGCVTVVTSPSSWHAASGSSVSPPATLVGGSVPEQCSSS